MCSSTECRFPTDNNFQKIFNSKKTKNAINDTFFKRKLQSTPFTLKWIKWCKWILFLIKNIFNLEKNSLKKAQ